MKCENEWLMLLLLNLLVKGSSERGYCDFPSFLWAPLEDGSDRRWLTKTEYIRNSQSWERQKEVTVRRTEMVIKHMVHAACDHAQDTDRSPCFRKDIFYDVICISQEPGDKFRVQQKGSETPVFTCMKFVKVNANIIQVFSAVPKDINEDRLCYEESLEREQWPWISPVQDQWSLCPLVGGFDFVTYMPDDSQLCDHVWRPSRIESECIYGEGMDFLFPTEECNPFDDKQKEQRLYCWGTWEEDEYTFTILGQANQPPQYALRLPIAMELHAEAVAYLYFSPVCPLSTQGDPPARVLYAEMRLRRSEPGFCFDESDQCRNFAKEGKCTNAPFQEYANFCKRSCGMCGSTTTPRPQCRFPSDYHGEWMMFETDRKESVTIGAGEITFSRLGKFLCKSKHWAINRYKLLSIFTNGCRPRYTCIHFDDANENILQFQISRSKHIDESIVGCRFEDDPPPLGSRIRSSQMKLLLPTNRIHWGSCGLSGEIRVNVSTPAGYCDGILTDWNPQSCNVRSKLQLQLGRCRLQPIMEHVCIAYTKVEEDLSLLITQTHTDHTEYRCWAVQTYPESMYHRPWRLGRLMPGAQCGIDGDMLGTATPAQLTVKAYSERAHQPCREINDRVLDDSTNYDGDGGEEIIHSTTLTTRSTSSWVLDPSYQPNKIIVDNAEHLDQPIPNNRISSSATRTLTLHRLLWWISCIIGINYVIGS